MTTQHIQVPEALRLADWCEETFAEFHHDADLEEMFAVAAELRRLHEVNQELMEALHAFLRAPHAGSGGMGATNITVQDFNLRAAKAAIAKATGGAGKALKVEMQDLVLGEGVVQTEGYGVDRVQLIDNH